MADLQHNSNVVDARSATNGSMQGQPLNTANGPSGDSMIPDLYPLTISNAPNPYVKHVPSMVPDSVGNQPHYATPTSMHPSNSANYAPGPAPNYFVPTQAVTSAAAMGPAGLMARPPVMPAMQRQQQFPQMTNSALPPTGHKPLDQPMQGTFDPSGFRGGVPNGPLRPNGAYMPNVRMPNAPLPGSQQVGPPPYPHPASAERLPLPGYAANRLAPAPTGILNNTSLEAGSCKSSRNPSPISTQRYDAMESQFAYRPSPLITSANTQTSNSSQSSATPSSYSASNTKNLVQTASGPPDGSRSFISPPGVNNVPGTLPLSMPPRNGPGEMQPIENSQGNMMMPPNFHSPYVGSTTMPGIAPPKVSDSFSALAGSPVPMPTVPPADPNKGFANAPPMPPTIRPGITSKIRQYPQQQHPLVMNDNIPASSGPANFAPPVSSNFTQSINSAPMMNSYPNIPAKPPALAPTLADDKNSYFRFQGTENIDLMQHRNILPSTPVEAPKIVIPHHDFKNVNCNPDIFRCTLTKIPGTHALLQKARLPLGILIHPFKDLNHLPVIQCTTIVRCRSCRTYINPFVYFVDSRRWKCNLCFRVNELPEEFLYDPVSKSHGDPARRPEIKSATIEFIAPSEYMLRPPQPAVYLFLLDVSFAAVETEYLRVFCDVLLDELDKLPGDSRTQIGFITYDSSVHFYNLSEGLSQPHMMTVSDIDDIFLPCPDSLLVNLHESKQLVQDLLHQLPIKFAENHNSDSALGAALQAAYKLLAPTGGRVTVVQGSIPNCGPGFLKHREDPNQRASKDVHNVGPANDFYKKLSLDCSGQQISVDLFVVATQYVDIATIGCIAKYSAGCLHYYPGFHAHMNAPETERFENDMRRYLTRKIGFEAVMRIRCTKGLAIHTFHGNFFVRSTDLLSLPNINPDVGFGMQISIEEQLTEANSACFQAALLYTSSKGERRIRVHTLCLGVTGILSEVLHGADQQAIVGLLSKMAVDRTLMTSLSDARDALINACIDPLGIYKLAISSGSEGLIAPTSLYLLPLYILALLKHVSLRIGTSTKLDDRVFAMNQMKTLPLSMLMLYVYPNLYPVYALEEKDTIQEDEKAIPQPPLLQLSSEKIDSHGAYLLDTGDHFYMYICRAISDQFCQNVLKASNFAAIDDKLVELPELENSQSELLRNFVSHLQSLRPFHAAFHIIREDSKLRHLFLQHLIEDRSESAFSYYEMLQHIKQQVHK